MTPELRAMLPEEARNSDHFGIAFGMGVDPTITNTADGDQSACGDASSIAG